MLKIPPEEEAEAIAGHKQENVTIDDLLQYLQTWIQKQSTQSWWQAVITLVAGWLLGQISLSYVFSLLVHKIV